MKDVWLNPSRLRGGESRTCACGRRKKQKETVRAVSSQKPYSAGSRMRKGTKPENIPPQLLQEGQKLQMTAIQQPLATKLPNRITGANWQLDMLLPGAGCRRSCYSDFQICC